MNLLDIILLVLLIHGTIRGISKGFLEQAVSLFGVVLAVYLAYDFSAPFCTWLDKYINVSETVLHVIGFAVMLLAVLVVVMCIAKLLTRVAEMASMGWINRVLGFVFSLFVPKIGVKLGKLKSLYICQYATWVSYVLYYLLGLKSYYFMTLISILSSAVLYLQSGFGANYVLDIGEYGYYKTGKDYRAVVSAFASVPMKLTSAIAGSVTPWFLSAIQFDKFNELNKQGQLDPKNPTPEFAKFQKQYMMVYCFVPLVCSVLGFLIFRNFYKITDDKAVFYAKENAAKAAAAKEAPAK